MNSSLGRGSKGFTLLEVLVVMSLLSLVMLGMGSALRTTAQTGERVDHRLLLTDQMRIATSFIYATLGRVSAQKVTAPIAEGESPFLFIGKPDVLAWIGIMPARYGAGGRYYFKLSLGEAAGEQGLVLQFMQWAGAPEFPDWSQAESRVLVPGATEFALQYFDASLDSPQWMPSWASSDGLPDRAMLTLRGPDGTWPPLVVPLRVTPGSSSGAGFGGAVFGGSS
jgi:general secretion pathway protein J